MRMISMKWRIIEDVDTLLEITNIFSNRRSKEKNEVPCVLRKRAQLTQERVCLLSPYPCLILILSFQCLTHKWGGVLVRKKRIKTKKSQTSPLLSVSQVNKRACNRSSISHINGKRERKKDRERKQRNFFLFHFYTNNGKCKDETTHKKTTIASCLYLYSSTFPMYTFHIS